MTNYHTLRELQNSLSGRAFVVGNGPSLADTDVARLKGEHVFGSNRVYLGYDDWDYSIPYWCIEDRRVARDTAKEWNALEAKYKFIPYDVKSLITNWDNVCLINFNRKGYKQLAGRAVFWPDFSLNPDHLHTGMTVTYMMLQIAFIMGCNPIYLIGVDHYYSRTDDIREGSAGKLISSGDDPDHFKPDYFGKGRRYHKPRTDLSTNAYRVAELTTMEHDLKIYNASLRTKLEVFERIDYDSLF